MRVRSVFKWRELPHWRRVSGMADGAGALIYLTSDLRPPISGPAVWCGAQARREGHLVDALALRGDEGRGTLRKARGRCERSLIPGSPNGATHPRGYPWLNP